MTTSRMTPRQSLESLQQESRNLLYHFAKAPRDAAAHRWSDNAKATRCAQLASFIKRDLTEFQERLNTIAARHKRTISSAVLSHPHHPEILRAGGDYVTFIDDATAALSRLVGELVELLAAESASLEQTASI